MILILFIFAGFVSSVVTAISILTQKLLRNLQRYLRDWARARARRVQCRWWKCATWTKRSSSERGK